MKPCLLIVDDDEDIRSQMKWSLQSEYEILTGDRRAKAMELYRQAKPRVVLLDLGLPPNPGSPVEGLATLAEMLAEDAATKVIVISGQSERHNALQAVGQGAYDFLPKPIDLEQLKLILKRAFHVAQLEVEYRELRQRVSDDAFEGILGSTPQMTEVFASVGKVAGTEVPVLILGESGTGKELVAQALHRRGPRKQGPFVAINCGAIPEALLESELFGHERGAFTGAHVQRRGRIESAQGGTLFLDEIGELPATLQVKLLRFLQEQAIQRIGGREPIVVDARVVAATNSDLRKAMTEGRFREDLFYRLAVVVIKLPPLRERANDIPLLARSFLQRFRTGNKSKAEDFSSKAMQALLRHSWPGNVRELENRVKRAVIMTDGRLITPDDLELNSGDVSPSLSLKEVRAAGDREAVQHSLRRNGGNISRAAGELGISRPALYELMSRLGISRADNAEDATKPD